jgi:Potassium-transporting ATPase A subunit
MNKNFQFGSQQRAPAWRLRPSGAPIFGVEGTFRSCAIAGSLAAKPMVPNSAGTMPTAGRLFIAFLTAVIIILGGLTFLPALALGPVAEHLAMRAGRLF